LTILTETGLIIRFTTAKHCVPIVMQRRHEGANLVECTKKIYDSDGRLKIEEFIIHLQI